MDTAPMIMLIKGTEEDRDTRETQDYCARCLHADECRTTPERCSLIRDMMYVGGNLYT